MTAPDAVSNLFVESLKLSAKQRKVLDVIHEHPRGITAARIATIMGTTVKRNHATNQNYWFGWPKWVSTQSPSRSRTTWQIPNRLHHHSSNSRMRGIPRHQGQQKHRMGPPQAIPTMLAAPSLNCAPAHSCTRTKKLPPSCATFTWACLLPGKVPTDGISCSYRIMVMPSAT